MKSERGVTQLYRQRLIVGSNRQALKRQRTNSSSVPDQLKRSRSPSEGGSDNDRQGMNGTKESRKIRGAAARNQREKELREKLKEKEAAATQRAEAARKREARSERRRGEGTLLTLHCRFI